MYRFALLLLLGASVFTTAQGKETSLASSSSASGETTTTQAQLPSAPSYQKKAETLIGSVAMDYVYVFQTSPYDSNRSLMGWSVVPEVNFTKHLGFQGDFTSLYMQGVYPGQSRFLVAAGPRYTFAPRSRFTPFVYGEGGEMRSTTQANHLADWNPVAKAGIGFDTKITRSIAFQLIPGEYMGEKVEWRDQWNHSFSAKAGIVFNLYK